MFIQRCCVPIPMQHRLLLTCLILLMSSLQGCLFDNDDSSSSSSLNCDDDNLDSALYGVWLFHTYDENINREFNFASNGEIIKQPNDPDFRQNCWYINGGQLIEDTYFSQQGNYLLYVNYHIDGDLLFYSPVNGETFGLNGESLGVGGYNDRPTECGLFHKSGVFSDTTTLNATINATEFPDFCTWIQDDPTGASYIDAWESTHYLAMDHTDSLTTGSNDNLMTIEIDEFFGEIDWYVSEYYYGFWLDITINNQQYLCSTDENGDCIIVFSGTDNFYAVWEENETATVSENGVDLCSVQCEIEINFLHLREEDTLPGTTNVTIQ